MDETTLQESRQGEATRVLDRRASDQRLEALEASVESLREEMPDLLAEGIRRAVGDPGMWSSARAAMQEQATQAAGNVLLSGVRYVLGRLAWAAILLLGIYMVGGLPALLAAMKMMGHDK